MERKILKVKPNQVKKGDLLAFTYYGKVDSVSKQGGEALLIVDGLDNNQGRFQVAGNALIAHASSADQVHEERKVTMTEAAQLLAESFHKPFTVKFKTQEGKMRTLRGRLVKPEVYLGRSYVEDLDQPDSDRMRQVDHRTIEFLVIEGVKYTVK